MPSPVIPKRKTRAEVVAASKRLAPNINETFIHKGKRISAWVDDKTKPISSRTGPIGYQKKLHPAFKKQKQSAKLTKEAEARKLKAAKQDKGPKQVIVSAPKPDTKKRIGKTPRHGPGTYGADIPSDTTYGRRKPVIGSVPPPRKPPAPTRTVDPKLPSPYRRRIEDAPPTAYGVGHGSSVDPVRNTRAMNAARAAKTPRHGPGTYGAVIPRKKVDVPPTAYGGISGGSDVDTTNVRNTRAMNAARAAEEAKRIAEGRARTVTPRSETTPAKPPTKISDPIEPEITAQTKKVLAERAAARAAKAPPKKRWPGVMQRRVSTKDQGVLETGMRLEGDPVERTELQKHQDSRALRKLVEQFGGSISDYWNATKNRPMTGDEARAKAKKRLDEKTANREAGLYDPLFYKGGQLKNKKNKKQKPSTSRRVKNKHSGYGKHDGNKAVSDSYD